MTHDSDREKHSERLARTKRAIVRQQRIARSHGAPDGEGHRFDKMHAMNCGNPKCFLCSNPRRTFKELTIQERRFYQDTED
jgi:hypothetical protein